MNPFQVVTQFEEELCKYTGAPHCVTVDSCTNALFLSLLWFRSLGGNYAKIEVPRRTYVGVAQSVINAGYGIEWTDEEWHGAYALKPSRIIDSAKQLFPGMYPTHFTGELCCLSFHIAKKIPLGRGGAILCSTEETASWLRAAKQDGRTPGQSGTDPNMSLQQPGYHMYMPPAEAARGLWLLYALQLEEHDDYRAYPDISTRF